MISMLVLAGAALAPRGAYADIIYTVDDFPSLQDGYTVSGTITTNGTIGTMLHPAHGVIKSWDIKVMQGTTTIESFTPGTSTFAGSLFDATSTSLSVATFGDHMTVASTIPSNYSAIVWYNTPILTYEATDSSDFALWEWRAAWDPAFTVASAAAVPEPSTAILSAIGMVGGIACGWVRQRRRQRRHDAA